VTSGTTSYDEDAIAYAGVVGQAALLRSGGLSSVELVEILLRRIARLDGRLRAFRTVLADEARAAAAEADSARQAGDSRSLLGVPIAIKDNVAVRGQAALLGTGSPEPVADEDAELVRRLRAAGLIILGLTHLPELALWAVTESKWNGTTRNPWDDRRAPGGSSGGSAAAVAAGLVPAAHATDGLGSIRIPASACGLVGLKPTHGFLPIGDHWNGLSHAGFVTRSVQDTAALLDAARDGASELASSLEPPSALRIAVSTRAATPTRPVAEVSRALDGAVGLLRGLGHTVVETDPPYSAGLAGSNPARYLAGVAQDVAALVDPGATEGRTRALARLGGLLPASTVTWARRQGGEFGTAMAAFFDDIDLLVTPTMPVLPRPAGALAGRGLLRTLGLMLPCAAYTGPWNACGLPAISLPIATTDGGLPIGIQLVGPRDSEALLLSLAAAIEPVAGWLERRVDGPASVSPLAS
jgi:amidase